NDTSTGTTNNLLVSHVAQDSNNIVKASTNDSSAFGVVVSGGGTSGSAVVGTQGVFSCVFSGTATANHVVGPSSTVAGDCQDFGRYEDLTSCNSNGASCPAKFIGKVAVGGVGAGTYTVDFAPQDMIV